MIEAAVLLIALSVFMVSTAFAMYWWARAVSAMCSAALNIKQVQAFDPSASEEPEAAAPNERAAAPLAASPTDGLLNIRSRLSDFSDTQLRQAVQDADVKVITMDENNGIDADVEPIPNGGRGVFARNGR